MILHYKLYFKFNSQFVLVVFEMFLFSSCRIFVSKVSSVYLKITLSDAMAGNGSGFLMYGYLKNVQPGTAAE